MSLRVDVGDDLKEKYIPIIESDKRRIYERLERDGFSLDDVKRAFDLTILGDVSWKYYS